MIPSNQETPLEPILSLRQSPGKGIYDTPIDRTKDKPEVKASENRAHIRCRQCLLNITRESERIQVNGMHQHVCTNLHGIVFEIGCFRTAAGCRRVGSASDEWSWFPGYSWTIAVCRQCLTHLGWRFTASTPDRFFGLIVNRLISSN